MRAMTFSEYGEPSVLKLRDDMPEPAVGPDDLLVEVHAAALNPVDTKIRRGMYPPRDEAIIPGYDVSGVVLSLGANVPRNAFQVGDAIYASPCLIKQGAHAERVAVDWRTAAPKPESLDHVHAAAMPLVTLTSWESLYTRARVHRGETVLIHAGAGGTGHIALQLARVEGCRVITTASRPETIALCNELGADHVINHRETDFVEAVMQLTDGKGCEVVYDTVGGAVFDKSLDCVAVNGRMVTIVMNNSDQIVPKLFRKNATLHMEFMGVPTVVSINPSCQGETLRTAAELIDAGKLKPHVHKVVPLEDLAAAHEEQQSGKVIGKIVIKVK
ncbi:MAG: zinc-binding dehydrogenase [Phycisphaera sp.]|nr:zinc-binding dehydrogenase [Phycisphaera sp.]